MAKRMTIKELILELRKLPPNGTWNGWDDESIIVYRPDGTTLGAIDPKSGFKRLP